MRIPSQKLQVFRFQQHNSKEKNHHGSNQILHWPRIPELLCSGTSFSSMKERSRGFLNYFPSVRPILQLHFRQKYSRPILIKILCADCKVQGWLCAMITYGRCLKEIHAIFMTALQNLWQHCRLDARDLIECCCLSFK